jgi:hypothetical protein
LFKFLSTDSLPKCCEAKEMAHNGLDCNETSVPFTSGHGISHLKLSGIVIIGEVPFAQPGARDAEVGGVPF